MLTIPIRPARPSDIRDIAGLIDRAIRISNAPEYSVAEQMQVMRDYSAPALSRLLGSAQLFLLAEMPLQANASAEPAGAIALSAAQRGDGAEAAIINALFVDPSAQGMGVGGALVDEAALLLRRMRVKRMAVHASLSAVGFYAHMGFSRVGAGRASSGVDIVRMERRLG